MKYLVVNSKNKVKDGSSTNFTYELSQDVCIYNNIKLVHASIPITNYLINESNNIIRFKFNIEPIFTFYTLPIGTYQPQDLCQFIQDLITINDFSIIWNQLNLKIEMTANSAFYFDFGYGQSGNLRNIMGYDIIQNQSVNVGGVHRLLGNNIVDFIYPNILYLNISSLPTNEITDNIQHDAQYIIPMTSPFGAIHYYNPQQYMSNELKVDQTIKLYRYLKISISDENNVNYNNINVDTNFVFQYC